MTGDAFQAGDAYPVMHRYFCLLGRFSRFQPQLTTVLSINQIAKTITLSRGSEDEDIHIFASKPNATLYGETHNKE